MLYAILDTGEKILAEPNRKGYCSICKQPVIAKCGNVNIWHFAHVSNNECDLWAEGETEWHAGWKMRIDDKYTEVTIGKHRADIKLNNGLVIELQNSPLSTSEIIEREIYYDDMIWLINCISIANHFRFRNKENEKGKYITYKWKWFRNSWKDAKKQIFLDLGQDIGILSIKKSYGKYGWGFLISYSEFCNKYGLANIENEVMVDG